MIERLEVFDEKPKKIARLETGESSIVPNEKTSDPESEKSEVSNFEINEKYTKERFHNSNMLFKKFIETKNEIAKKMFKGLDVMDKSWFNAMKSEMDKQYFQKLAKFVSEKRGAETVYPKVENVFRWTSKSLSKIKV